MGAIKMTRMPGWGAAKMARSCAAGATTALSIEGATTDQVDFEPEPPADEGLALEPVEPVDVKPASEEEVFPAGAPDVDEDAVVGDLGWVDGDWRTTGVTGFTSVGFVSGDFFSSGFVSGGFAASGFGGSGATTSGLGALGLG